MSTPRRYQDCRPGGITTPSPSRDIFSIVSAPQDDHDDHDNPTWRLNVSSSSSSSSQQQQHVPENEGGYGHGPLVCLERPFQTRERAVRPIPPGATADESSFFVIKKEATAQAMDSAAKGVLHASSSFFGPALISLATAAAKQAYCREQDDSFNVNTTNNSIDYFDACTTTVPDTADLHIMGVHPSSVLTFATVLATALTAILLPIIGALIDRSRHRKTLGILTALFIVITNLAEGILLSAMSWPVFWIVHALCDVLYSIHTMILLAYLQSLCPNDPVQLSRYSSKFATIQFACMAAYLTFVSFVASHRLHRYDATAPNVDTTQEILSTSRFSHIMSFAFGAVLAGYSWIYLFGHRGPRKTGPISNLGSSDDSGLCRMMGDSLAGLLQTLRQIRKNYPALKWLLLTLLWSPDIGSGSVLSVLSTLQKSLVQMNSSQIGISGLIMLLSTIFGARMSSFVCTRFNPLTSFRLSIVSIAIANAGIAIFVKGSNSLYAFYVFTALLGASLGWLYPTEKVLFCTLAPLGKEAETMGVILAVHNLLAWLPPLLFSVLNEAGFSLRWAVASQDLILVLSLIVSLGIGEYDTAVEEARSPSYKGGELSPLLSAR